MPNPVAMLRIAAGCAAGLELGYRAARALEALRDLRAPKPPLETPDAAAYGARRRALTLAGMTRSLAGLAALAFHDAGRLEARLAFVPERLRGAAFVVVLTAFDALRDWPVDYIEGHVLERRFGMTERRGRDWAVERIKATLLGAGVAALLAAGGDALARRAPRRWPLLAVASVPPLLILANVVVPTFVMPLFNAYTPLDGPLEARIRELAARYGAGDASILRFNMSKQTKKANAFVTGVLGTKRIALGDTLVDNFAEDETLFVVAHELGHYVRRDPWAAIGLGTLAAALTILSAEAAARRAHGGTPLRSAADGARFAFYAQLVSLPLGPLLNAASRAIERRADRFAIAATADAAAGARAFRRLRDRNLAEDAAPGWWEALFASHPPIRHRIAALEAAARGPA